MILKIQKVKINLFVKKKLEKLTLSWDWTLEGFEDLSLCNITKCTKERKATTKPAKKWILKNLVKVGLLTVNPP